MERQKYTELDKSGIKFEQLGSKLHPIINKYIKADLLLKIAQKIQVDNSQKSSAEKTTFSQKHPAEKIIFYDGEDDSAAQLKEVFSLIKTGCEQGIIEAALALRFFRGLLHNPRKNRGTEKDLGTILQRLDPGRYEQTSFHSFVENYQQEALELWNNHGKKVYEKHKNKDKSPEKPTEKDLSEVPSDFADKVKDPSFEGDYYENLKMLENGKAEEVEEKYKIQAIKMKQTLENINQELPTLIQDLSGLKQIMEENSFNSFVGKLKERFVFVQKNVDEEGHPHFEAWYEDLKEYRLTNFANEVQPGSEGKTLDKLNALGSIYKGYTNKISTLINIFQSITYDHDHENISTSDYQTYSKKILEFLKKHDIYVHLPKIGQKYDLSIHEPIDSEKDDKLPSKTIKEVISPGFYQIFEGKYRVLKKPQFVAVK